MKCLLEAFRVMLIALFNLHNVFSTTEMYNYREASGRY